jgi:hypothetical protein
MDTSSFKLTSVDMVVNVVNINTILPYHLLFILRDTSYLMSEVPDLPVIFLTFLDLYKSSASPGTRVPLITA